MSTSLELHRRCSRTQASLHPTHPSDQERTECFLAWLIPRARAVAKLTIAARRDDAAAAAAGGAGSPSGAASLGPLHLQVGGQAGWMHVAAGGVHLHAMKDDATYEPLQSVTPKLDHTAASSSSCLQLLWSNLVSALTLMGPSLRHLSIEWPDELQLGAWMATLAALEVGGWGCAAVPPLRAPRRVEVCRRAVNKRQLVRLALPPRLPAGCLLPPLVLTVPPPPSPASLPLHRQSASFTAPRIVVRPGLGSLPALTDLRFRSSKKLVARVLVQSIDSALPPLFAPSCRSCRPRCPA